MSSLAGVAAKFYEIYGLELIKATVRTHQVLAR